MNAPLTREQVEALKWFDVSKPENELVNLGGDLTAVGIQLALTLMIDTDAALRQRVELREQESIQITAALHDDELPDTNDLMNQPLSVNVEDVRALRTQLAAVTKERDILKQGWDDCADKRDVQDETIDQLKGALKVAADVRHWGEEAGWTPGEPGSHRYTSFNTDPRAHANCSLCDALKAALGEVGHE